MQQCLILFKSSPEWLLTKLIFSLKQIVSASNKNSKLAHHFVACFQKPNMDLSVRLLPRVVNPAVSRWTTLVHAEISEQVLDLLPDIHGPQKMSPTNLTFLSTYPVKYLNIYRTDWYQLLYGCPWFSGHSFYDGLFLV